MLKKLRTLIPIFPTYRQVLEAQRMKKEREVIELGLSRIATENRIEMLKEQINYLNLVLKTPE